MGIHGLSYFIKSFPSLVEKVEWTVDSKIKEEFIVDGNAFVHHIAFQNRTNWTHGGQYSQIATVVKETVGQLQKVGIQTTFLFDGSLPQDKLETRIKRHKSYIERSVMTFTNLKQINASNKNEDEQQNGIQYYGDLFLIPPLTLEVIIQTLREMKVNVMICQGEADSEVVELAEKRNGYIVSQDSDMHVYPRTGKGYIPLEYLNINDTMITAGVFKPELLASVLYIKPSLLPLFGTLLGNDYLDVDLVRYPIGQWCSEQGIPMIKNQNGWPKIVAEFIRRNCNKEKEAIQNVVNALKPIISKSSMKSREEKAVLFGDRIIDSILRYDSMSPLILDNKKQQPLNLNNNKKLSSIKIMLNTSKNYKTGYSRQIMDVIESKAFWSSIFIEDIEREFSWDVSLSLRKGMYYILQQRNEIEEYVREKRHLEVLTVQGEDSKKDFYGYHNTKLQDLTSLDSKLYPFILCTRYLIYHCSKSIENGILCNHEVIAIIISTLRSLAPTLGYTAKEVPILSPHILPALKKRSLHLSSQYQSVIYSSYLLSQILDVPDYFQQPQVLSHMYHGIYFHYYIEAARLGWSISKMLTGCSSDFTSLFCQVYKVIMIDLYDDVNDIFDYDIITCALKDWVISDSKPKRLNSTADNNNNKKKKTKKSTTQSTNRSTNAFNVLSFGCNFEE